MVRIIGRLKILEPPMTDDAADYCARMLSIWISIVIRSLLRCGVRINNPGRIARHVLCLQVMSVIVLLYEALNHEHNCRCMLEELDDDTLEFSYSDAHAAIAECDFRSVQDGGM